MACLVHRRENATNETTGTRRYDTRWRREQLRLTATRLGRAQSFAIIFREAFPSPSGVCTKLRYRYTLDSDTSDRLARIVLSPSRRAFTFRQEFPRKLALYFILNIKTFFFYSIRFTDNKFLSRYIARGLSV